MSVEKSHAQKAAELFGMGYNCSQAVVGAFADEMGMSVEAAVKMASPFGGGMGRMREVCGAVSGMFMVLGAVRGCNDPEDHEGKKRIYEEVRTLADEFKSTEGSIICRELLTGVGATTGGDPEKRTAAYYKKRPCPEIVARAAEILENFLESKKDA